VNLRVESSAITTRPQRRKYGAAPKKDGNRQAFQVTRARNHGLYEGCNVTGQSMGQLQDCRESATYSRGFAEKATTERERVALLGSSHQLGSCSRRDRAERPSGLICSSTAQRDLVLKSLHDVPRYVFGRRRQRRLEPLYLPVSARSLRVQASDHYPLQIPACDLIANELKHIASITARD
jgi:hypothetical protein